MQTTHTHKRLEHMPISLFATVMGLAGLTIATQKAETLLGFGEQPAMALTAVTSLVYLLVLLAYTSKWLKYPEAVKHEFAHPIRLSFFPASSIGMILLSIVYLPYQLDLAFYLWAIGSTVQLLFTLVVLSNWIHHDRFQIQHSNPAWFIPIVGNVLVPIAGAELGYLEVSWFFYSIGLMMWLPLLAVLLNRFFFHPMMPGKLLPTLFILIAPPAVGFISWMKLHHGVTDDVARILYYFALFTTLLLASQYKFFIKVEFALPWWAYSFPIAAITIASFIMNEHIGGVFFYSLSIVLYISLLLLMIMLIVKTVKAMLNGKICVPE
ncbi:MAG: SLAC1 anion channel family protein [Gammaproteobacteria bacterium]|nr:SLAC1 anion channel family protein [Gammaproteobacteria bacterium]